MVCYGTPMPPKLIREIWDYKNANSKDIDGNIFDLNWNLFV